MLKAQSKPLANLIYENGKTAQYYRLAALKVSGLSRSQNIQIH
jgi:hypothetical protein